MKSQSKPEKPESAAVTMELLLYIVPGNIVQLVRVPKNMRWPRSDLLTPPEVRRIANHRIPIDPDAPHWKIDLAECVYEFLDQELPLRRRVRVIYPKGQPPPSKEWTERAVANTFHSVH